MDKKWQVIGAAFGEGAQKKGTKESPVFCLEQDLLPYLNKHGCALTWHSTLQPPQNQPSNLLDVKEYCQQLSSCVQNIKETHHFPLVLGGDHSIAIGTWSGLVSSLDLAGEFGLIWVDAHMDAHTFETTPSKAIHGMPLAVLLGHGESQLTQLVTSCQKLNPKHVVLIGIRSFEPGEEALLAALNVKVVKMDEVKEKGFSQVWQEALGYMTEQVSAFGVSIDLDGFDPSLVPGVGSPEPDGLIPTEALPALRGLADHPKCVGLEVVEFNPELDRDNQTYLFLQDLLLHIFMKDKDEVSL